MTNSSNPPGTSEIELTLLGPGYGESVILHLGDGEWAIIDSCLDSDGRPGALRYLDEIGVDPAENVSLIVASHWHDDHIRGMANLVQLCPRAQFCCAAALCSEEFLVYVGALERRHLSSSGSGLREMYGVFSHLGEIAKTAPIHAIANRVLFSNKTCTVSSLSPDDSVLGRFLKSVGQLVPDRGENKSRVRDLSPNEASVALWIDAKEFALLLGADLEKEGWRSIVVDGARPFGKASAFKVAHHASENAHEQRVWDEMLETDTFAVIAPWRLGGKILPKIDDAARILRATNNAWITNADLSSPSKPRHSNRVVEKTLRESGVKMQQLSRDNHMVRLRRTIGSGSHWTVETFGSARHLRDYAA